MTNSDSLALETRSIHFNFAGSPVKIDGTIVEMKGPLGVNLIGFCKMGNADCWKTVDSELKNQASLFQDAYCKQW